jgi:hypothetical protein
MDIHQRLALFYEGIAALPAFSSHDQALAEISRLLTEIEDTHSGVPRDPTNLPVATDGRMYPPHPAYAKESGIDRVTLYTQKGHRTYIRDDGAVLIINRRTLAIEFEKASVNGGRIER